VGKGGCRINGVKFIVKATRKEKVEAEKMPEKRGKWKRIRRVNAFLNSYSGAMLKKSSFIAKKASFVANPSLYAT